MADNRNLRPVTSIVPRAAAHLPLLQRDRAEAGSTLASKETAPARES
jgi:hypothetical protein